MAVDALAIPMVAVAELQQADAVAALSLRFVEVITANTRLAKPLAAGVACVSMDAKNATDAKSANFPWHKPRAQAALAVPAIPAVRADTSMHSLATNTATEACKAASADA